MTVNKVYWNFARLIVSFLLLNEEVLFISSTSAPNLRRGEHDEDSGVSMIDNENERHARHLSLLSSLSDPRSVETKKNLKNEMLQKNKYLSSLPTPLDMNGNPRPLNILALGGAMTWGKQVSNRLEGTNPKLIGAPYVDHVDNFGIKHIGADYPSLCLESILSEAKVSADESYDIIFLEFAMNDVIGLPTLLKRVKERYPDAVIVFVKLWSIRWQVVERNTGKTVREVGKDTSIDWVWVEDDPSLKGIMGAVSKLAHGYTYELPKPERPMDAIQKGWFADDWHHLSDAGHAFVADDIIRLLTSIPDIVRRLSFSEKQLGSWSWGDKCFDWFETGRMPSQDEFFFEGASLIDILGDGLAHSQWVLEFPTSGGVIIFDSNFRIPVPLLIRYMTRDDPNGYPRVEVMVNGGKPKVLNPNKMHVKYVARHLVSIADVGWVEPGRNYITITPLEERGDLFRLAGVITRGVQPLPDASESILLPGLGGCDGQQQAKLETYRPPNPNGVTVLHIPGGAYVEHDKDIISVIDYFSAGYTVVILYYRLPRDPVDQSRLCSNPFDALTDVQSAMMHIQDQGPDKIIIAGFSAGGHLAALYGTTCNAQTRPDAIILHYPWLKGGAQVFCADVGGPVKNVGFKDVCFPTALVNEKTPPTVLYHAQGDEIVPAKSISDFVASLAHHRVRYEYYEVPGGGHYLVPFDEVVAVSGGALIGGSGYAELLENAINILHSVQK